MDHMTATPLVTVELLCGGSKGKAVMNANIVRALREIDRLGSVNKATKHLHMGYSNTLYAISDIEQALGVTIVERVCPKGSTLTENGHRLIELFESMQDRTQRYASDIMQDAGF